MLDRTDLASLLDELAQPATHAVRGRRWHCPVPNHEDRHASVTMHVDAHGHERWRCWSGDDTHRGDAIDLVIAARGATRADAIEWLAARAGLAPDRPLPPVTRKPPPRRPAVVPLDPAVVRYAGACEHILWTPSGKPVREWLRQRGLTDDVLRANHVGADPGRRLLPRPRGLPRGTSAAAVFPALDQAGLVRYLQARYLDPGDGPKYDNPAAALGSNPRLAWTVPTSARQPGVLIVCEGIPDALTAAQAGYTAVGILGSQAPDAGLATRLANRAEHDGLELIAVIDNDGAGHAWGQRLIDLLAKQGQPLTVIEPPGEGVDLNTWARHDASWIDKIAPCTPGHPPSIAAVDATHTRSGIELG